MLDTIDCMFPVPFIGFSFTNEPALSDR